MIGVRNGKKYLPIQLMMHTELVKKLCRHTNNFTKSPLDAEPRARTRPPRDGRSVKYVAYGL